jgi:hypothetical protein
MSEYEIGRDIQELKSRIERIETGFEESQTVATRAAGRAASRRTSGAILTEHAPIVWNPQKGERLPPFVHGLLRLPLVTKRGFDTAPQSKTWPCNPEPLILYVNWYSGGTDEFYRLHDQSFTLVKYTDPNSGSVVAEAIYSATLTASGKASSRHLYIPGRGGFDYTSQFHIILRNAQGAALLSFFSPKYSILCHDDYVISWTWSVSGGLYDLITGATWDIEGDQLMDGC